MKEGNKIELQNELENAPILNGLKGKVTPKVPENYFVNLENEILQKTTSSINHKGYFLRNVFYIAAAASVALVLLFVGLNKQKIISEEIPQVSTPLVNPANDALESDPIIYEHQGENANQLTSQNIEVVENKKAMIDNPKSQIEIQNSKKINNQQTQIANNNSPQNYPIQKEEPQLVSNIISTAISNNQTSQITTHGTMARTHNGNSGNLYLPSDTCVNRAFEYLLNIPRGIKSKWFSKYQSKSFKMDKSGIYWVAYFVGDSLIGIDSMYMTLIPKPQPALTKYEDVCNHESLLLSSGVNSNDYTFIWSVSELNKPEILLNHLDPGELNVDLAVLSCVDTVYASTQIHVNDCKIVIPNVITPNGDGYNDDFVIKGIEFYPGSSLTIIDRNGKLIYQSINYSNEWRAVDVPEGTYFYSLQVNDKKNTEMGGVINIIR